jgi:fatty-acyl-CoA synthase
VLSPESIQMILFTDGESGASHPALIPYRQTLSNAQSTALAWELGPDDCAIQATACFHASLHVLSIPLLAMGGRVVLMNHFDSGEYLRLLQRLEATVMFLQPDMYRALIEDPAFAETELDRVRWALCLGASCPETVARTLRERGLPFKRGYGATEAGVNCFEIGADEAAEHPESIGRPMPHVNVVIRRPDGAECAVDEVGELTFSGQGLCSGYLDPGEAWPSAYRDGWFWSGDLAQRDAEGRHVLRGRRSDVYVAAGAAVYPSQVEHTMERCFGVAECMVLSIPDARGGQTGLAAVVVKAGTIVGADALRRELRGHLPAHAIPSVILFVDELPRTPQGAPDRLALRRMLEAQDV